MAQHERSSLDIEAAFTCWYNTGRKRSYREVAHVFEVSDSTVRRAAWDNDWSGRAEQLDRKARDMVDKQLVALRARAMTQLAQLTTAELERFLQRPPNAVRDETGTVIRNPYLSENHELPLADLLKTVKLFEAAGLNDTQADRDAEEVRGQLEHIREEVAAMHAREYLEELGLPSDADESPGSQCT